MGDLKRAHMARIAAIRRRFEDGEIGVALKRELIEAENQEFYTGQGAKVPKRLTGSVERAPDEQAVTVIARARGAPEEQVRSALDSARAGSHAAAYADTVEESRRLTRAGQDTARLIMNGPDKAAPAEPPASGPWGEPGLAETG